MEGAVKIPAPAWPSQVRLSAGSSVGRAALSPGPEPDGLVPAGWVAAAAPEAPADRVFQGWVS